MNKVFLGFDPGYGYNKEVRRNSKGEIEYKKYPSIVAKAPAEAVDMPLFEGERYYMGEVALLRSPEEIVDITDYTALEKFAPLFLGKDLIEWNLKDSDIEYVISGLSIAQLSRSKEFQKRLSKFKVNDVKFDLTNKVLLIPQGVGAKYAIDSLYPNGPDTYLIFDIGMNTIDAIDVINGVVRPENVHGFQNEGVIRIARNIQDLIGRKFKENITVKEAAEILETKKFFLYGKDHDLSQEIEEFKKEFTAILMKTLKERFSREFKRYRKIYMVGGGAYYIDKNFSPIIEIPEKPEFFNALGNMLRGEEEARKRAKQA